VKKAKLTGGTVVAARRKPETVQATVTKLMKVIAIERRPGQKTAQIELRVKAGTYLVEIDEATARAIASVFDLPLS
jgi:hypothetical protein